MYTAEESAYFCPSFSSYSNKSPAIAAKISDEFKREIFNEEDEYRGTDFGDEFEFSPADDFVYAEQNEQFFPIFNRDLRSIGDEFESPNHRDRLIGDEFESPDHRNRSIADEIVGPIRVAMSNCSIDEKQNRDLTSSSSESEEIDGAPITHCMWRRRSSNKDLLQRRCKKSSSTGSTTSSKRFKLRDLLRRSNSEGKDRIVISPPKSEEKQKLAGKSKSNKKLTAGEKAAPPSMAAHHEEFYVKSKAVVKRRSYLPYRQDLVGFFGANVNVLGRTFA